MYIDTFLRSVGVKSSGMKTSDDDKQMIVNPIYGTDENPIYGRDEANENVSIHIFQLQGNICYCHMLKCLLKFLTTL